MVSLPFSVVKLLVLCVCKYCLNFCCYPCLMVGSTDSFVGAAVLRVKDALLAIGAATLRVKDALFVLLV